MKTGVVYRINRRTARHRSLIICALIVASAIVRVGYFNDLRSDPLLLSHLWPASDMHYFDQWARQIAAGDWLSRNVDPPVHNWQALLADEYFAKHPAERPTTEPGESAQAATVRRNKALWKRWLGEGKFYQEPLYPYLIALTYRIVGDNVRWVFAWQMLAGIALNLLGYYIARRAFGDLAGLLAAVLLAFYSPLLLFEMILLRDSLVAMVTLLLTALAMRALRKPTGLGWTITGLCSGAAVLLKSNFAMAIIAIPVLIAWQLARRPRRAMRCAAAFGIGVIIALSPLIARNILVGAPPLATSGSAAPSYIISNAEDAGGASWGLSHVADILDATHGAPVATVIQTLKTHGSIGHYLHLCWEKFDDTWRWYEFPGNENFYYYRLHSVTLRLLPFTYFILAPLGLLGLGLAVTRRRYTAVYLPIVINLPVLLLFFVQDRYRIALAAGLAPFAAWALAQAVYLAMRRRLLPAISLVGAFALLILWTGRPLPEGADLIRPADYWAPYYYSYGPTIRKLMDQHDPQAALAVFDDALVYQPNVVRDFKPGSVARSAEEKQMFGIFSQIYLQYAVVAREAGHPQEAAEAAGWSKALLAATK